MEIAFGLVVLVAAVIAVTGLCRRLNLASPLVLIAVGIVASYLPFVPEVQLSAEVVLIGLLPPLLYSAALNTSLVDFNANRRPILLLSVGLVVFTTLGIGALVHLLLPDAAVVGGVRHRRRGGAAGRGRRDRDRAPDRAARAGSSPCSRASRCSTTRPRWSRCAPRSPRRCRWPRSGWTS